MNDRKELNDHDVALVTLCESYSHGKRGPERRALMAKIINMALQRAEDNEKLQDQLGAVFERVLEVKQLKDNLDRRDYEIALRELLEESMITGIDKFDIIPQTITEFFKQTTNDGFNQFGG